MSATVEHMIGVLQDKFKVTAEISGTSRLGELGMDSLDIINFLFTMEQGTGVKIPDEVIAERGLETIEDLAAYIDENRS